MEVAIPILTIGVIMVLLALEITAIILLVVLTAMVTRSTKMLPAMMLVAQLALVMTLPILISNY